MQQSSRKNLSRNNDDDKLMNEEPVQKPTEESTKAETGANDPLLTDTKCQ